MSAREELLQRAVDWFAANGVGDTSLRTLASQIGTSHRMLNYHFGSRDGLLGAVVEGVERAERDVLIELVAQESDPVDAGLAFWHHVADSAQVFAPLYFELAGHAMQGKVYAGPLREWLASGWTDVMATTFERMGFGPDEARALARLSLAMARGLLFELALTGDREAADAAMSAWTAMVTATAPR